MTLSSGEHEESTADTRPRRILVVDDNRDAAESLSELLELLGAEAHVAFDGQGALSGVEQHAPDLVLLDIGLPDIDGYEVARRIRARAGDASPLLVAVTGWGQEEDRKRARDAGFDHHMVKPADVELLEALLESLEPRTV